MVCSIKRRGKITLIHGINLIEIPDDGLTVAELRLSYRDVLNVGPEARPYVNGNLVEADYVPLASALVEFVRDWGRKAADLARHDRLAIDRINQTPMADLRFRDLCRLKSGWDEFSKMRLADLREAVGLDVITAVAATFPHDEGLQARCYRWVLRGLDVGKAICKVNMDVKAGENAKKAWAEGRLRRK
jgi:hypothetical protein